MEAIVERILSDARADAERIVEEAKARAEAITARAESQAAQKNAEAAAETERRAKSILDGKEATARLDSARVLLAEKRRVIDTVYSRALSALVSLDEKQSLELADGLLKANAEEGDEVLFAENYGYAASVTKLPVFKSKRLSVSKERAAIDGGFVLRGEKTDKNLSYGALLAADREENQATLSGKLFRVR